ncbi:MAG: hypothetical protein IJV29_05340 [Butyrivibrio sp.]|nr:hypothetical protein [Butyrivibrio sp.]
MKNSYKNSLIFIALVISFISISMGIIGGITVVSLNTIQSAIWVLPLPSIFRLLMILIIVIINFIYSKKNKTSNLLAIISIILVTLIPICNIVGNRYMQLIYISKGTEAVALYSIFENSLELGKIFADVAGLILCAAMGVAIYEGSPRKETINGWFIISVLFGIVSIWISFEVRSEGFRELTGTSETIPTLERLTTFEIFALVIPIIIIATTLIVNISSTIGKSYIIVVTVLMSFIQIVYAAVRTFEVIFVGLGQSTQDLAAYGTVVGMVNMFAIPIIYMAEVFLLAGLGREYNNIVIAQTENQFAKG